MKKKTPRKGFENYDLVIMPDVVTFGTTLFMRKGKRAIKIVFPAGQMCTFAPMDENQHEHRYYPSSREKPSGCCLVWDVDRSVATKAFSQSAIGIPLDTNPDADVLPHCTHLCDD